VTTAFFEKQFFPRWREFPARISNELHFSTRRFLFLTWLNHNNDHLLLASLRISSVDLNIFFA